jgi:hypothetical protein
VYIRSLQTADALSFRGFMFAESTERDWYSLMDGYVCQPDVPHEAWPGIALRSAAGSCAPAACGLRSVEPAVASASACAPCREVSGGREHRLRVYAEMIWPHEATKPAAGTGNRNRTCMPFPFRGEVPLEDANADFYIRLDGFKKTAKLVTGAATVSHFSEQPVLRSSLPARCRTSLRAVAPGVRACPGSVGTHERLRG